MSARPWSLVADLGGTSARFGLAEAGAVEPVVRWETRVNAHEDFAQALTAWLAVVANAGGWEEAPVSACFAIASPQPEHACVRMLNAPWILDKSACADALGLRQIAVLNDFEALGYAIGSAPAADLRALIEASGTPGAPALVMGPGTGLGTCSVHGDRENPMVIAGEGGHVDLPVTNETEWAIHNALAQAHGHVSAERALSGAGLVALYRFFGGSGDEVASPEEITAAAKHGNDEAALRAVMQFCAYLGAVCGNAVLTLGARGGVFLAGNILADVADLLAASSFTERFQEKGRYRTYLQSVPVHLLASEGLALRGALRYLNALA